MRVQFHDVTENLAGAIRAMKTGRQVVLTEKDIPVALIEALRPASKEEEREILRMIDLGLLLDARKSGVREWKWKSNVRKAA